MWRNLIGLSLIASLSLFIAGCSLVQLSESSAIAEYQPQTGITPVPVLEMSLHDAEGQLPKLEPHQMKTGQHVMMLAGGKPDSFLDEVSMLTKPIVGTVKQLDGDRVVLQDVMIISESRSSSGVPVVNHVPYFSRLFKSTSIGRTTTPIPGEVTIELSNIHCVSELTDDRFLAAQKNGGCERIGVDFDFNVVDGEPATAQQ